MINMGKSKEEKELEKQMKEKAKLEEKRKAEEEKRKKEEEKLRKKGKLPAEPEPKKAAGVEATIAKQEFDPTTGKKKDNAFSTGKNLSQVNISADWLSMLYNTEKWLWLPFSHGTEMELIICDAQGRYLEGDQMVFRMEEITKEAKNVMIKIINNELPEFPKMPDYIRNKIKKMPYNERDVEKGLTMKLCYDLNGQEICTDSFGRDGNVTAITYILELVTPPCLYAEELAYWASTLFNLASYVLPKDLFIVASAFNPAMKEYNRGLSQGDHHHIGSFASTQERAQAYSMIRNFIPHIIGLSVNSPIIDNKPTDVIKVKDGRYTCPNCIRSIRLINNTTMLSSNEPKKYPPYLATGDENELNYFLQVLQKASLEDARFQDVFPFTNWGTMEVRVMDAQLSICRRIGLGLLVQAFCYKARKLNQQGKWVPNVNAETITFNRRGAIERGLIGTFKVVNLTKQELAQYDPQFAECYIGPDADPNRYLFQAVQRMFLYLKDVLMELNYLYSPFMKPLLQSVFGSIDYAQPPLTEAEYQLSVYHYEQQQGKEPNVLNALIYFTKEYSKDPIANPLTGPLTLPDYMR